MSKSQNRIGIFGGTFDPIHLAHIKLAEKYLEQFHAKELYFIPCYISPFKTDKDFLIDSQHRIKMIELSINENPKFKVDTFEIENQRISYTYLTIKYFKSKLSNNHKIDLLIGEDQAINLHLWKNWEYILENSNLCIAKRDLKQNKVKYTFEDYKKYETIDLPTINISSSQIRANIQSGISIEGMVDNRVITYIEDNKLYI